MNSARDRNIRKKRKFELKGIGDLNKEDLDKKLKELNKKAEYYLSKNKLKFVLPIDNFPNLKILHKNFSNFSKLEINYAFYSDGPGPVLMYHIHDLKYGFEIFINNKELYYMKISKLIQHLTKDLDKLHNHEILVDFYINNKLSNDRNSLLRDKLIGLLDLHGFGLENNIVIYQHDDIKITRVGVNLYTLHIPDHLIYLSIYELTIFVGGLADMIEKEIKVLPIVIKNYKNQIKYLNHAELSINLPQKEIYIFDRERIVNVCCEFLEAMEFEMVMENEPIFGSFFQRFLFKRKSEARNEISELYKTGKDALNAYAVDKPNAENTNELAQAAANLIGSINDIDEAVLRLGAVIIIKTVVDGKQTIIVDSLSYEMMKLFDNNPGLLKKPRLMYELMNASKNKEMESEESIASIPD